MQARAQQRQAVLERMIATDEGARRLGEVALVPAASPIAQTGLLFLNTLFDENAASHDALEPILQQSVLPTAARPGSRRCRRAAPTPA